MTSQLDSFAHPPSIPSHLITQPRIRPSVLVIARTGLGYLLLSSGYTEVDFSVFERKFQFLKAGASNLTHTRLTSLAVRRCPVALRLRANSFSTSTGLKLSVSGPSKSNQSGRSRVSNESAVDFRNYSHSASFAFSSLQAGDFLSVVDSASFMLDTCKSTHPLPKSVHFKIGTASPLSQRSRGFILV